MVHPNTPKHLTGLMAKYLTLPFIYLFSLFVPVQVQAQDSTSTIKVYLDCRRACSENYVREEIKFVNYVRNIEDADVHLLITNQRTGSGGEEYTLQFIGRNQYADISKTRTYYTAESDTEDEERLGLNQYIKLGLFPFLQDLPITDELEIMFVPRGDEEEQVNEDKWNYWVFDIGTSADIEGQKSEKEISLYNRVTAERITPEWKFELELDSYNETQTFKDGNTSTTFKRASWGSELLLVKSINEHWSAGITAQASHSTRSNYDLLLEGSPAIEYSVFPYKEFTQREITFLYRITAGSYDYNELTVYGKESENLLMQQLRTNIEFTQPWGEFEARINGSAFMHDFTKNRLDTRLELDLRIFRGLSINLSGEYAWINNQLSIPADGITEQEQLLNLRERATSYRYELRFGFSYSFGSIYNNVVNPRL